MCGLGHGIKEATISIRCEVDGDMSPGSNGTHHLNIQIDFAIGAVRVTNWRILSSINRHTSYSWQWKPQLLKKRLEITVLVASPKLDERNTLTAAGSRGWKVVEPGEL